MANKWVYTFKEGNMTMRNLLGGKGANLAEMTEIGLPVPQGFTIIPGMDARAPERTEVGKKYFEQLIDKMKAEKGVEYDVDLTAADLKTLAEQFKAEYKKQLGEDFPSDPVEQLKYFLPTSITTSENIWMKRL